MEEDIVHTGDNPGCEHYIRICKLVSPCCDKIYPCRFCHNDNEIHEINRFDVREVVCSKCDSRQNISNECVHCGVRFAKYYCHICKFFDDRIERNYYHCDKCGICRVAENRKYIHCDMCNTCVSDDNSVKHICRANIFNNECPICLEDMFHSIKPSCILNCGHPIHTDCLQNCIQNNKITCSLCRKIVYSGDTLKKYIEFIDARIELYPVQDELFYDVQCNDCLFQGQSKHHPFGMKCGNCGGYNTKR